MQLSVDLSTSTDTLHFIVLSIPRQCYYQHAKKEKSLEYIKLSCKSGADIILLIYKTVVVNELLKLKGIKFPAIP